MKKNKKRLTGGKGNAKVKAEHNHIDISRKKTFAPENSNGRRIDIAENSIVPISNKDIEITLDIRALNLILRTLTRSPTHFYIGQVRLVLPPNYHTTINKEKMYAMLDVILDKYLDHYSRKMTMGIMPVSEREYYIMIIIDGKYEKCSCPMRQEIIEGWAHLLGYDINDPEFAKYHNKYYDNEVWIPFSYE